MRWMLKQFYNYIPYVPKVTWRHWRYKIGPNQTFRDKNYSAGVEKYTGWDDKQIYVAKEKSQWTWRYGDRKFTKWNMEREKDLKKIKSGSMILGQLKFLCT